MSLLKTIEELPPNQRSSRIGQAGVIKELRQLPMDQAVAWLKENISSPVSTDWGRHLYSLGADWSELVQWMHLDKIHAIATIDAVYFSIEFTESLPKFCDVSDAESEIKEIYFTYQSPRIKKVLDAVEIFANPPALSKSMKDVAQILVGPGKETPIIYAKGKNNQWHSLLNKTDRKYCLAILDWKATEKEQEDALMSLPIFQGGNGASDKGLVVVSIDRGNDEIILISLPSEEIEKIQKLAPKSFKFKIEPNKASQPTPKSGAAEL